MFRFSIQCKQSNNSLSNFIFFQYNSDLMHNSGTIMLFNKSSGSQFNVSSSISECTFNQQRCCRSTPALVLPQFFNYAIIARNKGVVLYLNRPLFDELTGVPLRLYIYNHFFDNCTIPMVEWSGCSTRSGATQVQICLSAFDV